MPNSQSVLKSTGIPSPDYQGLVKFLIEPLLESPKLLSLDCEHLKNTKKVWIRLAFKEDDKGRIYGRGGRNIHAIRTVLQTAAEAAGETLYLEIYNDENNSRSASTSSKFAPSKSVSPKDRLPRHSRRPLRRRPMVKPRLE
jgi:predicted RNA-binding protein YlqC (UPF0109 family)